MPRAADRVLLSTGVIVEYVDIGARANEALVLLPGLGDSWRSYELVLQHLPTTLRAIAVSQRGHGDSDKPEQGYSVQHLADDVKAFLDALAIERAVIAGHSSASLVARRFALDHPGRVSGLVLEASFIKLNEGARQFGARLAMLEDPVPMAFAREFASVTSGRPVSPEFLETMINESLKVPARVWRRTVSSMLEYDDSPELGKLGTTTLALWGDSDGIVDRAATDELLRSIPRSRLIAYEGVGHTPHWEDPARFARDVAAFIDIGVTSA